MHSPDCHFANALWQLVMLTLANMGEAGNLS